MGRGPRNQQAVVLGQRMSGPRGRQIFSADQAIQSEQVLAVTAALEANRDSEQAFDEAINALRSWRRPMAAPDKPESNSEIADRQATEWWRGEVNQLRRAVWAAAAERVLPEVNPAIDKAAQQFGLSPDAARQQVAHYLTASDPALGSFSEQAGLDKDKVLGSVRLSAVDQTARYIRDNISDDSLNNFARYPDWLEQGKRRLLPDRDVSGQLRSFPINGTFRHQVSDWILSGANESPEAVIDRSLAES